jgi:hypothetical protein
MTWTLFEAATWTLEGKPERIATRLWARPVSRSVSMTTSWNGSELKFMRPVAATVKLSSIRHCGRTSKRKLRA